MFNKLKLYIYIYSEYQTFRIKMVDVDLAKLELRKYFVSDVIQTQIF